MLKIKLDQQNKEFDKQIEFLENTIAKIHTIDPKKMQKRLSYQNIEISEIEGLAK